MTLDSPPAPLASDLEQRLAPHPLQHDLQHDTLPWTGVSVLLAILGLLLFMAVPERHLSPDELESQRLMAQVHLAYGHLSSAIEDYRSEHGQLPGDTSLGAPAAERDFQRQLMLSTDEQGHAVPQALASHPFGPYLPGGIPQNPINGRTDVRIVRDRSLPSLIDGESGWVYDASTGELSLNAPGQWGAYRGEGLRF